MLFDPVSEFRQPAVCGESVVGRKWKLVRSNDLELSVVSYCNQSELINDGVIVANVISRVMNRRCGLVPMNWFVIS